MSARIDAAVQGQGLRLKPKLKQRLTYPAGGICYGLHKAPPRAPSHGSYPRRACGGCRSLVGSYHARFLPRTAPRAQPQFGPYRVYCACLDARWTSWMVPSRLRASCARCRARSAVLRVVGAQTSRFGAASRAPKNTEFVSGAWSAPGPGSGREP